MKWGVQIEFKVGLKFLAFIELIILEREEFIVFVALLVFLFVFFVSVFYSKYIFKNGFSFSYAIQFWIGIIFVKSDEIYLQRHVEIQKVVWNSPNSCNQQISLMYLKIRFFVEDKQI